MSETDLSGRERLRFLAGLKVLELGDGVAGSAATNLLASLGADVTAVVDAASAHRHAGPRSLVGSESVSLLSAILDHQKRLIPSPPDLAPIARMIDSHNEGVSGGYDLVVVDRVDGVRGALFGLAGLSTYLEFVRQMNPRAWLTISAFGLSGPRRADGATELTLAAATGLLSLVREPGTSRPRQLAGYHALLNTAQAAALASCHAIDLAARVAPVHLDLSAAEATVAMSSRLQVGLALLDVRGRSGAKRYGVPANFYHCGDGMIRISALEDHQWRGLVRAMGSPAWTDAFDSTESRIEGQQQIDRHIGEWTRTRTKAYSEEVLQTHGVPATAMNSPAEILDSPQLAHREALDRVQMAGGQAIRFVRDPYHLVGHATTTERPRPSSLQDLTVTEFSHVLAVPLAGALLGALGANVTKVEDPERLDMYRRRGPYIGDIPGINRAAYFALANHSKRSAALELDKAPEEVASLLEQSDVVLENLGIERARRVGLRASDLTQTHPHLLAISSTGFGGDGPTASYRAYAYNLQAACGLSYLTRDVEGRPPEIDIPWADLLAGYALATVVAAWTVGETGNAGAGIDFAMADLVSAHFNEFVAAASLGHSGDDEEAQPADTGQGMHNGIYETADGWIAISIQDYLQYGSLVKLLHPTAMPLLGEAVRTWKVAVLARELRQRGVFAEEVVNPKEVAASPQLNSRGFFVPVEHPEWGTKRIIGLPWRPFGEAPIPLSAPPCL